MCGDSSTDTIIFLFGGGLGFGVGRFVMGGGVAGWPKHTEPLTDIATYRLNWPRGRFSVNLFFSCVAGCKKWG